VIEIAQGVAKPESSKSQNDSGNNRYPTADLSVGAHFVVPAAEYRKTDEKPSKFRNRVHQSVQAYARRFNQGLPVNGQERVFSVILLGAPTEPNQKWVEGDVGVWRDA